MKIIIECRSDGEPLPLGYAARMKINSAYAGMLNELEVVASNLLWRVHYKVRNTGFGHYNPAQNIGDYREVNHRERVLFSRMAGDKNLRPIEAEELPLLRFFWVRDPDGSYYIRNAKRGFFGHRVIRVSPLEPHLRYKVVQGLLEPLLNPHCRNYGQLDGDNAVFAPEVPEGLMGREVWFGLGATLSPSPWENPERGVILDEAHLLVAGSKFKDLEEEDLQAVPW